MSHVTGQLSTTFCTCSMVYSNVCAKIELSNYKTNVLLLHKRKIF